MPFGLYSDPYLKTLIESEPKLAQEFFEALVNSDWNDNSVIYCLEVPGWVLEKVGPSAAINPNHPLHQIDDLIKDRETIPQYEKDPKSIFWEKYWGESYHHFISSIPYLQLFKVTFFMDYDDKKFNSLSTLNPNIEKFFTKMGHHLSLLLPSEANGDYELTRNSLLDLNSNHLMQRLFWTDLCERTDFKLYRRNAYRTDDLFISHPILGRDFKESDSENATWLGGVIHFPNEDWLIGEETLGVYGATQILGAEESLEFMLEDERYELLGLKLIALALKVPELKDKYGFELTDSAQNWMIEAVLEWADMYAESYLFDVTAELNSSFDEPLSWQKIPDSKKEKIFDLLSLGFNENESKLRNDCRHFLGCMALHKNMPKSILVKLSNLKDPLIDEVLVSRNF